MKKVALVTGAGRGIGRSAAVTFARNGYDVAVNAGHNADELEQTRKMAEKEGARCLTGLGDVSDPMFVEKWISAVYERFGAIDVLVNNAGISKIGLLQDMSPQEWDEVLRVNLTGAFHMCRSVIPGMVAAKQGRIINISSVWGVAGASCEVAYSASKGGLNTFTKALAKELAPSGIAVNALACGIIDTRMNSAFTEEEKAQLANEVPMGRFGTPDDVAKMVVLLANAPVYLTGQIIGFNGGWE